MKETLTRIVDVRLVAKRHPWLVVGCAVAAGVAAGAAQTTVPGKTAETTGANSETEAQSSCRGPETPQAKPSFFFSAMATVVEGVFHAVVNSLIAAAVVAPTPTPDETSSPSKARTG